MRQDSNNLLESGFRRKIGDLCFGLKKRTSSLREEERVLLSPPSQTILVLQ